jgi:hypothetical protein
MHSTEAQHRPTAQTHSTDAQHHIRTVQRLWVGAAKSRADSVGVFSTHAQMHSAHARHRCTAQRTAHMHSTEAQHTRTAHAHRCTHAQHTPKGWVRPKGCVESVGMFSLLFCSVGLDPSWYCTVLYCTVLYCTPAQHTPKGWVRPKGRVESVGMFCLLFCSVGLDSLGKFLQEVNLYNSFNIFPVGTVLYCTVLTSCLTTSRNTVFTPP